jgi:hypothetical protein
VFTDLTFVFKSLKSANLILNFSSTGCSLTTLLFTFFSSSAAIFELSLYSCCCVGSSLFKFLSSSATTFELSLYSCCCV